MNQEIQNNTSGKTDPDPLAGFHQVPIISVPTPGSTYVGRVIVELWETPGKDDASNLVLSGDPTSVDWTALIQRVSKALAERIARQPQLFTNP